uniref:Putative secreted protein n=1 Tax=Anopheles darlingi TaxID=43151 RepID=A0A2M4DG47_ANODA
MLQVVLRSFRNFFVFVIFIQNCASRVHNVCVCVCVWNHENLLNARLSSVVLLLELHLPSRRSREPSDHHEPPADQRCH